MRAAQAPAAILACLALAVALTGSPRRPDDPPGMALIPAGEFWQGRVYMTLLDELGMLARARMDDIPAHAVYLDAFYIDRYEVTNADYQRFTDATKQRSPHHWISGKVPNGQEKFPVYNVSYDDAVKYCTWAGKRLPTESEWEKAARGGADRLRFPWGDQIAPGGGGRGGGGNAPRLAHFNWPEGPVAVGTFQPNGYGLYDVVGNVAEWVADWYGQNFYSASPEKNPKGPARGMYRVVRSGSWNMDDERHLAVNYRNFADPNTRAPMIGFRCAK